MRTLAIAACAGALTVATVATAAGAQDASHGAQVFSTYCAMCHSTQPGKTMLGPSLHGVVGRKAGAVAGFGYSPALKASGVVWTPARLDAWLADPRAVVPGNRMPFPGLHAAKDRADVIAYLAAQK